MHAKVFSMEFLLHFLHYICFTCNFDFVRPDCPKIKLYACDMLIWFDFEAVDKKWSELKFAMFKKVGCHIFNTCFAYISVIEKAKIVEWFSVNLRWVGIFENRYFWRKPFSLI